MIVEQKVLRSILFFGIISAFLMFAGCHGSDEAEKDNTTAAPSATALMQKQVNDLKAENASLKQQVEKLQQDNRTATAHSAELETQLAEMKEQKPAPQPVVEQKAPPPIPSTDAGSLYNEALSLYRQRSYRDAEGKFEAVSADGGPGGLADKGTYWTGECLYAMKNYKSALESFRKVLDFSGSTKKDDAQMMIGNCYMAMGSKAKAKAEFKKLIADFPASPYVARAKAKLKNL